VTSPRDELWIELMLLDGGIQERLWDGDAPPAGAPGWYGEMSDLIQIAIGPPEPDELALEPVVVEDMRRGVG
jgi:hypothetical protein